jgi:hypothetical protein
VPCARQSPLQPSPGPVQVEPDGLQQDHIAPAAATAVVFQSTRDACLSQQPGEQAVAPAVRPLPSRWAFVARTRQLRKSCWSMCRQTPRCCGAARDRRQLLASLRSCGDRACWAGGCRRARRSVAGRLPARRSAAAPGCRCRGAPSSLQSRTPASGHRSNSLSTARKLLPRLAACKRRTVVKSPRRKCTPIIRGRKWSA